MTDKIQWEIENNNLEIAKIEITKLEETLLTEKSEYSRCKLLENINKYKNLYSEKINIKDKDIDKIEIDNVPNLETFKSSEFILYEDLHNLNIKGGKCVTGKIKNCKSSTFEYLEIQESLVIEDCTDCIIICKTKQLRIKNSKKLSLKVYIEAGTSLENCKDITFTSLDTNNNNYRNVRDFTTPFNSTNYSFVDSLN